VTGSPYATTARPEIHALLPDDALRYLDVGCNDGGFGDWLQQARPGAIVSGIELDSDQASTAAEKLKGEVVQGSYPEALNELPGVFDCITFNHVLEHMVDPWTALGRGLDWLAPRGSVVAVIPNIRYAPVLADLVVRGKWEYQDAGILDRTHLRFFTRQSALELFTVAGLRVVELTPVNLIGSVSHPRLARTAGRVFRDFVCGSYAIRAVRA
jgi:2-polyprenyl-3-methyl-5-hydroxy-6-metoxy-1,4-benzoquinol methylase